MIVNEKKVGSQDWLLKMAYALDYSILCMMQTSLDLPSMRKIVRRKMLSGEVNAKSQINNFCENSGWNVWLERARLNVSSSVRGV
jgi:hypothetical protein